ncbi:MAG TPA: hypothetical protein VF808_14465 [Ktedonobacterales bacterium]
MKSRVMVSTTVTHEIGEQLEDAARREHLSVSGYTRKVLLHSIGAQTRETKTQIHDTHSTDDSDEDE